jgi:hypothetical protein
MVYLLCLMVIQATELLNIAKNIFLSFSLVKQRFWSEGIPV